MDAVNPILEVIEASAGTAADNAIPDKLISADSHVTEPPGCYIDRIDPAFRDRAPRVSTDRDGGDGFVIDGMPGSIPMGIVAAAGKDPRDIKKGETLFADLHRGGWNGADRIADQDRDGIAAEVIYPSVGMVLCNHPDVDYKHAAMWAYNRWLHEEFCAAAPDRLLGMGQTAVRSVAEAVEEFRQFKEMGFRGVMMPGNPGTEEDYDHPSFDPLWRAAVELQLPLSFHILTSRQDGPNSVGGAGTRGGHRGPPQNASQALLKSIQDIIGLFIWGRVFERHPELRVTCVEADAGWAPHFAYRMDHGYKRHRFWMKMGDMSKMPSEYFFDNVYLTFQDDWTALKMARLMNPRRLMWANDFPHSDSTWPWSRALLKGQTAHLTDQEKAWILRDNAAELYKVDLARI
ncbi:amidohydrolase family protein [Sphingomonas jatrophae]|uniref:Predicted metal-dependent hydrolase, TIM-barrel fold n=1 Tax=Sphingomonas jatrophae TaxID=1166337 RepID=A0A1I6M1P1_9SPHN|nr:amidohydrolase family protein [Sphingomonas jatrophae]SFS09412.1 Predicted metal-dependent hydrolase, TIM-barrel fold [Sphingomonas jatrophae]